MPRNKDTSAAFQSDGNAGAFASAPPKPEGPADAIGAAPETPEVTLTLRRQRWTGPREDLLQEAGVEEFPARAILDTVSVERLEHSLDVGGADWVYETAVEAGIVEPDEGNPFEVDCDSESVDEYIQFRKDHGLLDPIAAAVPFSRAAQRKFIGEALVDAYQWVNISVILRSTGDERIQAIRDGFREASDTLRTAFRDARVTSETTDFWDHNIRGQVDAVTQGDPRSEGTQNIAIEVAANYADWIINRDASLAAADTRAAYHAATGKTPSGSGY